MKTPLVALALAALLTGCSFSMPLVGPAESVRYYVLSAPEPMQKTLSAPRIGIMPVALPDYLERMQLVTRKDDGVGITVHDFDRWGEELDNGIARIVCDTLASQGRSAVPLRIGVRVDSRLSLDLRRFDGQLGGDIVLDAVWTLQKSKDAVQGGRIVKTHPAGHSLKSMVEAQSLLIQELAKAVSKEMK